MKRKLKVNDFFCGCGGMGIAFKNAGYEIAGAWDFDKYAVESYRANVGDHAVTTTVFTAIAEEIAKSIYAAEESEEQNMEAENKNFTGMNEPEEKPTAESILAAAEAEAKVAAGREETTKTAIPAEETITPNSLANGMLQFLLDSGIVASACVTDETEKMFAKHIKEELDGITIGETPEILRDWETAQNAVNDMLSKYAPGGYMGKIIYPLLTPLKERLEAGERTPDLYNAIVEATR